MSNKKQKSLSCISVKILKVIEFKNSVLRATVTHSTSLILSDYTDNLKELFKQKMRLKSGISTHLGVERKKIMCHGTGI